MDGGTHTRTQRRHIHTTPSSEQPRQRVHTMLFSRSPSTRQRMLYVKNSGVSLAPRTIAFTRFTRSTKSVHQSHLKQRKKRRKRGKTDEGTTEREGEEKRSTTQRTKNDTKQGKKKTQVVIINLKQPIHCPPPPPPKKNCKSIHQSIPIQLSLLYL
jgi:hypothetical protein